MKIKTKLLIMAIMPGLLLLLIGTIFIVSNHNDSNDKGMVLVTDQLMKVASELVMLTYEHSLGNEDRQHRQWIQRSKALNEIIEQASGFFKDENEKSIFEYIVQTQKSTKQMFEAIETSENAIKQENKPLASESRKAYLTQMHSMMLIELQSIISRADMLKHLTHSEAIRRSNNRLYLSVFFIVVLAVGIPLLSIAIISGINKSIKSLTRGTDEVSSGNLDYRIGLTAKDELGYFSRNFDRMTEQLQNLTASKAALRNEINERIRTEEKLKRFTAIIEATTDFVGIADADGRVNYINPAGRKMMGFGEDEDISETTIPDYLTEKSQIYVMAKIIPLTIRHGSVSFESDFLSRSGQIIPFSGVALSHKNNEGDVEFLSLIARDITDRKRMEEALIAEKNLSDSIIGSMPGIFYLFDSYGTILRWNSNSLHISGFSSEEVAALHPLDFFHGKDKLIVAQKIQEVLEKGEASTEAELLTKDGRKIPFFLTGKRIKIGVSKYIIGVGIDITQRRKAEKEVKRFTDIIELTSDFVGIADAQGKVLYANPAGRKMLGMGMDEDITNTSISEYFTAEIGRYIMSVVVPLSIENRTFEYEAEFLSRSGRLVPFSGVSLSPKSPDGTMEFLSLIARDITERKKMKKK